MFPCPIAEVPMELISWTGVWSDEESMQSKTTASDNVSKLFVNLRQGRR